MSVNDARPDVKTDEPTTPLLESRSGEGEPIRTLIILFVLAVGIDLISEPLREEASPP